MKSSFILMISLLCLSTPHFSQGIIIDHNCTDTSKIPAYWIEQAKASLKIHYAHTSHGKQITSGISRLADPSLSVYDPRLAYTLQFNSLPNGPGLRIMDGQLNAIDTTPELYWKDGGDSYTREVLQTYSSINVSMFCWCRELDHYSEEAVDDYLTTVSQLEEDFPKVIFVYMTGNAEADKTGGYNRYLRNEKIREFCRENDKVLFDFADIDVWSDGEKSMYSHDGKDIPTEHLKHDGEECMHATYLGCEKKGKAFWWLMARLAGWSSDDCDVNGDGVVNTKDLNNKLKNTLKDYSSWITDCWLPLDECGDVNNDGIVNNKDMAKKRKNIIEELKHWLDNCGWNKTAYFIKADYAKWLHAINNIRNYRIISYPLRMSIID